MGLSAPIQAFATTLTALLLAAGLSASASADEHDLRRGDPVVTVTGDGGDISVAGAAVTITGEAETIRAAGATVTVRANATRSVQVAGAQVIFNGVAGGDLQAAGGSLDARGRIGRNADLAGAVVGLNAVVGRDVRAGAATLIIGLGSDIAGDLKAGAATMTVNGRIAGRADLAGALVTINARIDGDVEVRAAHVVINSAARIGGRLIVHSINEPTVAEGAEIAGGVTVSRYDPREWVPAPDWAWLLGFAAFIAAGTVLTGIVLMLFGGRVFTTATSHVRQRPVSSFLFGVLTLVLVPFVAVLLMATVIGISVGLAIGLIVPFLIVFGHAIAAAGIASGILVRRQGDLNIALGFVMLILGAILLVAIGLIPYVGPILVGIALVLGVGAFTRTVGGRLRRAEPPPPPPPPPAPAAEAPATPAPA